MTVYQFCVKDGASKNKGYKMNVGSVGSGGGWSSAAQSVSQSVINSTVASASQEALETTAAMKAEAAKGDQQAIRKLARLEAAKNVAPAQEPTQPVADTHTSDGSLNVTA